MSFGLPYGWGCRFASSRANRYCFAQSDRGWKACLSCDRIKDHPDYDRMMRDIRKMYSKDVG